LDVTGPVDPDYVSEIRAMAELVTTGDVPGWSVAWRSL
jgi:hypothetical protein